MLLSVLLLFAVMLVELTVLLLYCVFALLRTPLVLFDAVGVTV